MKLKKNTCFFIGWFLLYVFLFPLVIARRLFCKVRGWKLL